MMKNESLFYLLLRGKLVDYYTKFDEATKSNFAMLKQALQGKAGLVKELPKINQ